MIDSDHMIGIIHFENYAKIILPMTVIYDSTIKKKVINLAVPHDSSGRKSNIWNGKKCSLLSVDYLKLQIKF